MKTATNHLSFAVKPSTIQNGGVGVFLLHDIAEGTPVAIFPPRIDERVYAPHEVPDELQAFCITQNDGTLLCPTDFCRLEIGHYVNHSVTSNLRYETGRGYIARRDIKAGEELFADYRELGEPEESWSDYYTKG